MSRLALIVLSSLLLTAAQAMPSPINESGARPNGGNVSDVDTQHQGSAEVQRHRHRHHHRRRK